MIYSPHLLNFVSEQEQLKYITKFGYAYGEYITNPSEAVQLKILEGSGYNISWINNPSESVQMEAIRRAPAAIKNIENPSEKLQLEAVKRDRSVIQFIKNQSVKAQLESLKYHNDHNIRYTNFIDCLNDIEALKSKPDKLIELFFKSEYMNFFNTDLISEFDNRLNKLYMRSKL